MSLSEDFETLFKDHYKRLCSLSYNLVRDAEASKDIVQEVFLKVWKNKETIDLTTLTPAYLFKATSNSSLNYLRDKKNNIRLSVERSLEGTLRASSGLEEIGYTELEVKAREAIDRLPPKCKVIYLLSRQEEMSYKQIAETLDLSVKTIESQMSIALQKLREDLKPFIPAAFALILLALLLLLIFY